MASSVLVCIGTNYGFHPSFNYLGILYLTTDIDECSENRDNCGEVCQNIPGSYSCSCRTGYRLASDGAACDGIDLNTQNLALRFVITQILTSALKIQMDVHRLASILLEATPVPVLQAIA
jgi:hypothetical protein